MSDIIRVLRVIEYVGDRAVIEQQVKKSIHGEKEFTWHPTRNNEITGKVTIKVTTIGTYPEVLENVKETTKQTYVLTKEYNLYDQQGEYFVEIFKEFPTKEQLLKLGVNEKDIPLVINGGGRPLPYGEDDVWFNLHVTTLK